MPLVLIIILSLFASGCATTKFDINKKVEVKGNFFIRSFKQKNNDIDIYSVASGLAEKKSTQSEIQKYNLFFWPAMILAVVGGFQIGSGKAKTGVPLLGGAFGLAYFAENHMLNAIDIHNAKPGRAEVKTTPILFYTTIAF